MQLTISFKLLNYLLCFQILLIINACYKLCMCKRVYKFGTTINTLTKQNFILERLHLPGQNIYIIGNLILPGEKMTSVITRLL